MLIILKQVVVGILLRGGLITIMPWFGELHSGFMRLCAVELTHTPVPAFRRRAPRPQHPQLVNVVRLNSTFLGSRLMPDFVIPEFHVNAIDTPLVAPCSNAVEIRPKVAVSAMPVPEEQLRRNGYQKSDLQDVLLKIRQHC